MDFKNAIALITGGSDGIGYAIAKALGAEGAQVTIMSRSAKTLAKAAGEIGCEHFVGDVGDPEAAQGAVDAVMSRHGRLDILVNNAGTKRT
jgi:NAD(P)-dependent dehydrogenase (short-subunit alcohol dehydrogenase family)